MKIITIGIGFCLIVVGLGSYVLTGVYSRAVLFSVLFGLAIAFLGAVALRSKKPQSHAQFGAFFLAVLGVLVSLGSLFSLYRLLTGGEAANSAAVATQSIMAGFCILLIVLSLLLIEDFWQGWKAFGHILGDVLARVVLTIFYFTVFVPFAVGVRLLSDPLQIKKLPEHFWRPRTTGDQKLEEVLRQF